MSLNNLMIKPEDANYFDPSFCVILETLLPTLRASQGTRVVDFEPGTAERHKGDFYGLLQEINVNVSWHFITMRLNGYFSPFDYDGKKYSLLVPSTTELSRAMSTWKESFGKLVAL